MPATRPSSRRLLALLASVAASCPAAVAERCAGGACVPGRERCRDDPGRPRIQPAFHLMDSSCGENDPNGIFHDPVHGLLHFFHQKHIAAPPYSTPLGPDQHGLAVWGHFASRDGVRWAQLPAAIWNGLEVLNLSGINQTRVTPYDTQSIYTGSATLVPGLAPPGTGGGGGSITAGDAAGVLMVYPGLCRHDDWAGCHHGTLLNAAVPADYATDPLLRRWKKPDYNPIATDSPTVSIGRDPSTGKKKSLFLQLFEH
jgi:hypothetical protein